MDIRKLQRAIVDGLEDVKGQNILVFNTEHLSPLFERVIIASGTSNRQTKALASSVRETVKGRGMQVMRTEGEDNGEWIIVDCGAAVVHLMQPAIRTYYHLEEIWGGKLVKMAASDKPTGLVKASEEPEEPVKKKMAVKMAAKKAAPAKKVAAAPAPAKKAAAPAKKVAAKKTPSKAAPAKTAPAKKGVSRTVGVKKVSAPVKTMTVGLAKPGAKKAVAKNVASKKAAAKAPVKTAARAKKA